MNARKAALSLAAFLTLSLCAFGTASALDGRRYGDIQITAPPEPPHGVVLFFSDRGGRTAAADAAALMITKAGALVIEINTPAYLRNLDKIDERCHSLVGDAESLSHRIQRERKFKNYFTPILTGVGEGGTVAELALAEAPAATIAGAVSLDPAASVASQHPICTSTSVTPVAHGFAYGPPSHLPGKWTVGLSAACPIADRNYVLELQRGGAPIDIKEFRGTVSPGEAILAMLQPELKMSNLPAGDIAALPLTILPVEHPSGVMAVVLSGDGGWRDLDKTIAEDLQRQGVPVVGWDSLRYFWSAKTPDHTAADLAAVLSTYMDKWHADKVALIGYSFGADVLPFAYNRLPEQLRSRVALISLLGFANTADFEVSVGEFLGESPSSGAPPVAPELKKIPPALIQCFYGKDEKDTACPELVKSGAEVIRTDGGHHFDGNYGALARRILLGLERHNGAS